MAGRLACWFAGWLAWMGGWVAACGASFPHRAATELCFTNQPTTNGSRILGHPRINKQPLKAEFSVIRELDLACSALPRELQQGLFQGNSGLLGFLDVEASGDLDAAIGGRALSPSPS